MLQANFFQAAAVQDRKDGLCTSLKLHAWNLVQFDAVLMSDTDVCLFQDPVPYLAEFARRNKGWIQRRGRGSSGVRKAERRPTTFSSPLDPRRRPGPLSASPSQPLRAVYESDRPQPLRAVYEYRSGQHTGWWGLQSHILCMVPDENLFRLLTLKAKHGEFLPYTNGDQDVIETVFSLHQSWASRPPKLHADKNLADLGGFRYPWLNADGELQLTPTQEVLRRDKWLLPPHLHSKASCCKIPFEVRRAGVLGEEQKICERRKDDRAASWES